MPLFIPSTTVRTLVVSDEPMGFIGDEQNEKGFDLTYAISVNASGQGKGEPDPPQSEVDGSGAPAPVRYDNQIVWIENVTKTTTGN